MARSKAETAAPYRVGGAYAWYVVAVLTLVSAVSLIDRQIITILAGDIKRDLGLSDAEIGLAYGTVFAVFYAVFGISLGRLADNWRRTRLMALGLAGWSIMTVASGLSGNLGQFILSRAGVAVGEAAASPAAYSLLSDWFPKHRRATVIAIYSCGVSIGLGTSLGLGGGIVQAWNSWFPAGRAPLGLAGWQAAFVIVGAPGLLLAILVATLREPPRGLADGVLQTPSRRPFKSAWEDLMAVVPPLSVLRLVMLRAPRAEVLRNVAALIGIGVVVALANMAALVLEPPEKVKVLFVLGGVTITGHLLQWATVGLGAYVLYSWAQSLKLSDRPTYTLLWATPTMVALTAASALFMTINYGLMGWSAFYAVTRFHAPLAEVGMKFGAIAAIFGLVGTYLGGWLADFLRRWTVRGRLLVSLTAMVLPWPLVRLVYSAPDLQTFLILFPVLSVITTAWLPGVLSTCQELVLPRMRGATGATFNLASTMIGLGSGPYLVGLISDVTGDLKTGVLSIYLLSPLVWICMVVALRGLPKAEATLLDRARQAGEVI